MKSILVFLGLFASIFQVFPQSVIYKTNGESISVYNLNVSGKTLSFNLAGDAEDVQRYMSTAIVDSIRHEDGSTDAFLRSGISNYFPEEEEQSFNRFFIGVDVSALTFYDNITASFEYLTGKGYIGLYASHSINTDPQNLIFYEYYHEDYFYGNITQLLHWNSRAGINAYIFRPGSFRLSSGLHYVRGRYTEEKIIQLNEEPWTTTSELNDKSFNALFLSPGLHWQWKSYLRLTLAIDLGIYRNPNVNSKSVLRSEISLNF
jgi:hypothetical protein